ncbi:hypothetical protein ACLOJK_023616 [Asimina triloba]
MALVVVALRYLKEKVQEGHIDKYIIVWARGEPSTSTHNRHNNDALRRLLGPPTMNTELQPLKIIYIIHGGVTQGGHSMTQQRNHAREVLHLHNPANERCKQDIPLISKDDDARNIQNPHEDPDSIRVH